MQLGSGICGLLLVKKVRKGGTIHQPSNFVTPQPLHFITPQPSKFITPRPYFNTLNSAIPPNHYTSYLPSYLPISEQPPTLTTTTLLFFIQTWITNILPHNSPYQLPFPETIRPPHSIQTYLHNNQPYTSKLLPITTSIPRPHYSSITQQQHHFDPPIRLHHAPTLSLKQTLPIIITPS